MNCISYTFFSFLSGRETEGSTVCVYPWQRRTVPSKAEEEKDDAEESGHGVADQWIGVAGTEVEAKPEGSGQGRQLARQKIHLCGTDGD